MLSVNSSHDLVIPISLKLNGPEELPLSFLPFLFLQPSFCSLSKMSLCFSVIMSRSFSFSGSRRPTIQSTCDSLLLLSGNPITPAIYLSRSHSILCLCLFNTRWSCLPGIGCLVRDFQLMGWRRKRERGTREWRL